HDLVREAEASPSAAALARGHERVAAWLVSPEPLTARAVRETGRAAAPALLAVGPRVGSRTATLALLADVLGPAQAVLAVAEPWRDDARRVDVDLPALGNAVPYADLELVLGLEALPAESAERLASAWRDLTLGLSRRWLIAHPRFLQALRHEAYAVRNEALELLGREGPSEITPSVVAYGLADRAALLRRTAAALAGEAGFRALARRAAEDPAAVVREEAVRSVARLEGRDAVAFLVQRLETDEAREVRAAAALALVNGAGDDPRAIDALLRRQVEEEPVLRDAIGARLAELPAAPVVEGIARGWQRALERTEPSRGYLFRTALIFGRATGQGLGYYPDATREELRGMLDRMRAWLAAQHGSRAAPDGPGGLRTRTGRGR
ncbi:MAG: HEAT repeat domain-containing protein, partial [Planctomycetota bacterium]|nr:HEAT repeat domain-containing protein [Planctomycetota bacterium]